MTQRFRTQLLYCALALYAVAGLAYWSITSISLEGQYWHSYRWSRIPFQVDEDSLAVTGVDPAAAAAGIAAGDRLEGIDGHAYTGVAEWRSIQRNRKAGEPLWVTVRHRDGQDATVRVVLAASGERSAPRMGEWYEILCVAMLLPLVSLLIGLWVAAVRPRDRNAWLLLVLLTFPSVFFLSPNALEGGWLVFSSVWFQGLQMLGFPALFLFGVYFPERWRLDARAPWLKYAISVISLLSLALVYLLNYHEMFDPVRAAWAPRLQTWLNNAAGANNLVCLFLYWAAIFDKLHSASTADARRRMRVLSAGSVLGLGGVLIFIVLLPHLGWGEPGWAKNTGAILYLVYPFTLAYVVLVERAMDVRILLRMGTKYALARATIIVLRSAIAVVVIVKVVIPELRHPHYSLRDIITMGFVALWLWMIATSRGRIAATLQAWIDRRFFRESYDAEQVLSELSDHVRRITEPDTLVQTVTRRIGEVLHVPEVAMLVEGGGKSFEMYHANGLGDVRLPAGSYTVRNLRRTSAPVRLYRDNPDGWFLLADEEERGVLNRLGTELLLPVPGRDRLMGILSLGAKKSQAPYTPSDLRLLQNVATQAGLALEIGELGRSLAREATERERFHREIEIAREVQERLFPQSIPAVSGATLAGYCRPAQGVGGDYYDLIAFADGRVGIAVGDVSGKGISAALLMASLRASLRGMTMDGPGNLERVMEKVNRLVFEASAANRYATFFFAAYDPRTRELRYVNAGHNPPFVVRHAASGVPAAELITAGAAASDELPQTQGPGASGGIDAVVRLESGGPVVGLFPEAAYLEGRVLLKPGDLMLAYTDGISEAMTLSEEEWGEERMLAAACDQPGRDAQVILRCVFESADRFSTGAPQYDDMTLVVLKLNEPQPLDKP